MKKRIIAFTLGVFFLGTQALVSQSVSFSGNSDTWLGFYFPGTKNEGKLSFAKEVLTGVLEAGIGNSNLYISGNLTCDMLSVSNGNVTGGFGGDLKEAYFSWTSNSFSNDLQFGLKIGRQINAWGKADSIRIADVLCSQDYTNLTSTNYVDSRIGTDAIRMSLSGNVFTSDVYVIPIARQSLLPLGENDPVRDAIIPTSINSSGFDIPVKLGTLEKPEASLENFSYAARVSFWLPALDFSLYGYYGFDDMPIMDYKLNYVGLYPSSIEISGKYYKYLMAGFDVALPLGEVVIRAESAFFFDRAMNCSAKEIVSGGDSYLRKNAVKALMGIDWMPSTWTITAQVYDSYIFDYSKKLDSKENAVGTTLSISKKFFQETLAVSFVGVINWNDFDSVLELSAEYSLTDEITLSMGAVRYLPGIENEGGYGAYKNLSNIYMRGIYRF
jgi:hypothetical protein